MSFYKYWLFGPPHWSRLEISKLSLIISISKLHFADRGCNLMTFPPWHGYFQFFSEISWQLLRGRFAVDIQGPEKITLHQLGDILSFPLQTPAGHICLFFCEIVEHQVSEISTRFCTDSHDFQEMRSHYFVEPRTFLLHHHKVKFSLQLQIFAKVMTFPLVSAIHCV